jgi:hypothetical protein
MTPVLAKSLSRCPCIELGLGLNAFPILAGFFPPTFYFTLFALYFMEGRCAGYIPTVSETGTEFPNAHCMAIAFATVAASIFYSGFSFYWYLVSFYPTTFISRFFLVFSTLTAMFGFIGLSNFPVNIDPYHHFVASFAGLGSILLMQLVSWLIVYRYLTPRSAINRFLLVLLQIIALCVCGYTEAIVGSRARVTTSALSEYTILVLLPFFFLSFSRDLAGIDQYLIALDY